MHKILIIEDDPVIAKAMGRYIQSWGHEVLCVKDFQHVMRDFIAFDPHMVLVDVMLPFFNGYHWCA